MVTSENSFLVCQKSVFHRYRAQAQKKKIREKDFCICFQHSTVRRAGKIAGWMHGEVRMQLFLRRQHY